MKRCDKIWVSVVVLLGVLCLIVQPLNEFILQSFVLSARLRRLASAISSLVVLAALLASDTLDEWWRWVGSKTRRSRLYLRLMSCIIAIMWQLIIMYATKQLSIASPAIVAVSDMSCSWPSLIFNTRFGVCCSLMIIAVIVPLPEKAGDLQNP